MIITLRSIRYNMCVCHSPVYHNIIAAAIYLVQCVITAFVVVM